MAKKRSKTPLILGLLAVVLLTGAAGGGWWVFVRHNDPLRAGDQRFAAGDVAGAQIEYRNAVRRNPDSAAAHLKLAQVQLLTGDAVAAEKETKAARELGADRSQTMTQLGQIYLAEQRYRDVLAEVPTEAPTPDITARFLMMRSGAQAALNDPAAAEVSLAKAEKAAPDNAAVALAQARLAFARHDLDTADKKADQALSHDPKLLDAMVLKTQIAASRHDRPAALTLAGKAIDMQPKAIAPRLERANLLMDGGDDKGAQADVNAVLANQPRNAGAIYFNAVLMVRAAKFADALTELQKLGPTLDRFPRALFFQAVASANLGQTEAAIDAAQRYLVRVPGDRDAVRLLAQTELSARRPDRAVADLRKAVDAGVNDPETLDLLGRALSMNGQASEAAQVLQKASSLAPDNPTILGHLAATQMAAGDPAKATAALERSVDIAPQQANASEALVAAALAAGDFDRADEALGKLRERVGDTEPVSVLSGMVRLGRLDLEGARNAFADGLKRFPDSAALKLNLAKVLVLQGHIPEADKLLTELLTKDPADLNALSTMVQVLVNQRQLPRAIQFVEAARAAAPKNYGLTAIDADLMVRSSDPRRAVGMLTAMRGNEPLPPVLLAALARAQVAAGMTDDAKQTYTDLLGVAPKDFDARRQLVDLYTHDKQTDQARTTLRQGLEQDPGNLAIMEAMLGLEQRTDGLDAALALAKRLRTDTTNLPSSTLIKGDLLVAAGKLPEAADAYREEYTLQPTALLAVRLANALVAANRDDDAIRVLNNWKERSPDDPEAAQMLGMIDLKHRRYDDAAKNLDMVLAKRPSDAIAMNNLAWVYFVKGDPRARNLAQRSYLQTPSPEAADTLGWIMVSQGDVKAGLPLLQQAALQQPANAAIKYHLAAALNQSGNKDEAIKVLQPVLATPGDFEEKPAAQKLLNDMTAKK